MHILVQISFKAFLMLLVDSLGADVDRKLVSRPSVLFNAGAFTPHSFAPLGAPELSRDIGIFNPVVLPLQ